MFLWKTLLDMPTHFERDVLGMCVVQKMRAFLSTFVQLGNTKRKGYSKDRVSPYIHIYVHHALPQNTPNLNVSIGIPVKGWKKRMTS